MELYLLEAAEITPEEIKLVRRCFPRRYERARRMAKPEDARCVLGSGVLLYRVLQLRDEALLQVSPEGRPWLPGGPAFSLSHSGGRCVLAVGKGRVGVDLELLDPENLIAAPAALTPEELEWIRPAPLERFHVLWTRKESLYKAIGGFSDPKEIPALDGRLPEGLFVKSILKDGWALGLCSEEEPGSIEPVKLT